MLKYSSSMKCDKCKNEFVPVKGLKRYCSLKCRNSRKWSDEDKNKKSTSIKNWYNSLTNEKKEERRETYKKVNGSDSRLLKILETWNNKVLNMEYSEMTFYSLRKRIILEQDNECKKCKLSKWMGEKIVLELNHIDGNNTNNDRENLEAICPNCHSLTETWRGKNVKKRKIDDESFLLELLKSDNIHQALINLGLSPKGNNYRRARRILEKYFIENGIVTNVVKVMV